MTQIRRAGLRLALAAALSSFAAGEWASIAEAAKPTHQQAMAACRAKYGKKVTNAIVNKNGSLTCQWQVMRPMTKAEAWAACKKKFGATTAYVWKKKSGWWYRYMPGY